MRLARLSLALGDKMITIIVSAYKLDKPPALSNPDDKPEIHSGRIGIAVD